MRKKILVVDDEKPIADILLFNLSKEGYEVQCAYDGLEALDKVNEFMPDLVLLDIMLPHKDGLEVCREIRKNYDMPVIMLTAKDSELDIVLGLEMGADDYMTKPFSTRELLARLKANLRRHQAENQTDKEEESTDIVVGDLTISPASYTVLRRNEQIHLTHREFELLLYLANHLGQVLTREHLLQTVWGYDYFGDVRTVDVTIRRMREKLEDNPSNPQWIITRRGVGYYLNGSN